MLGLLAASCLLIFGDFSLIPIRLHVLAFAVLPFVMWGAIRFGPAGAALSVFLIATIATILTAIGSGPFAVDSPFINAVLLDVLFAVLAVSGLTFAAVITEREQAESEREQLIREQVAMDARLHLATIVESSHDAIISTDMDGTILSWNAAAQHMFEFTEKDAVGQPITILMPEGSETEGRTILSRLRAGERIVHFETTRITKSGKRLTISLSVSPVRDGSGVLVGSARIARDISLQKRAEEALSSVGGRLIEAQEQERTRIARELHDDIGQRIALLTIALGTVGDEMPALDKRKQALQLQRQASEIASDIQVLSHKLHSPKVELLGFATGMRLFCREFGDLHKARVNFTADDLPDSLPSNISTCFFRVMQEALQNAAKHSGVRQFDVEIRIERDDLHLVVRDHGAGFDVEAARRGRGIGLISMSERLRLIDGELSIISQPRHGVTVHARAPFKSWASSTETRTA
jgi:PAS domain S-box-containing protein